MSQERIPKSGLFISLEGGEGVGKSTFASRLRSELVSRGYHVHLTREPGGTLVADRIRQVFALPPPEEPLTIITELMLLSAARQQHIEFGIKPQLAKNSVVICDRFADSSRVYQGVLGGIPEPILESIIRFSTNGLEPDVTFILDCDLELSQKRLHQRTVQQGLKAIDGVPRFDAADKAFHQKLRQAYRELALQKAPRTILLNTGVSIEKTMIDTWRVLEALPSYQRFVAGDVLR